MPKSRHEPGSLTPDQLRKVAEIEKLAHSVKEEMRMSRTGTRSASICLIQIADRSSIRGYGGE